MNKIDYALGVLKRLVAGSVNTKPYVMLDDVEYVIRNGGVFDNEQPKTKPIEGSIKYILDRRPSTWPVYYDDCDAQDYHEWFIKGTNIKLGFDYINGKTGEHHWYKIVCDGYDQMDSYDTEKDFLDDIDWMLKNEKLSWRYYEY